MTKSMTPEKSCDSWNESGFNQAWKFYRQMYLNQRNSVVVMINLAKADYYKNKIAKSDPEDMFKIMKELSNPSENVLPEHKSDKEPAKLFATFFTNKISHIRNSLTRGVNPISRSLLRSCVSFPEFLPVSNDFVLSILKKFPKKSCVLDPMPTKLLYQNIGIILPVITRIVNSSLTERYFPSSLKNAVVRPLLKKSSLDSNSLGNYRPVSNLPFLGKVIKRWLHNSQ